VEVEAKILGGVESAKFGFTCIRIGRKNIMNLMESHLKNNCIRMRCG
jgi:hypothetical protein